MRKKHIEINIADKKIGNNSVFIIAELSANHNQSFDQAVELIKVAKEARAKIADLYA